MSKIAGFFPIGDPAEGQFVVAEWYPDPEVLEQEILKMASDFNNWIDPMIEARQVMIQSTKRRFDTQTDPSGQKWRELDPDYAHAKERGGFPDEILVREDTLRPAATSESAWLVTEREIMFNAEAVPFYGAFHQEGTGYHSTNPESLSARKVKAMSILTNLNRPLKPGEAKFVSEFTGRGKNLPARPFIGPDLQAVEEIQAVFVRHMDKTVTDVWSDPIPGERIENMGTNVLGTFPIIGYTKHGVPILRTPHGPRFGKK